MVEKVWDVNKRLLGVLVAAAIGAAQLAVPAAVARSPRPIDGDVDNDGYAELVVGNPHENLRSKGMAGVVNVLYGGREGVTNHDQRWHRDRRGVKGIAVGTTDDDRRCCLGEFGAAVATGDFDGDGHADVAATAAANPARNGYRAQPAGINVLYGSEKELTAARDQLFTLSTRGIRGSKTTSFPMVVTGDFNGDGRDELVFFDQAASAIHVLKGTVKGLVTTDSVYLRRATRGVRGGGAFVGTMTVGDFNGDGRDDLAAAANESFSGSATVFYGGAGMLSAGRDEVWSLDSAGVPGQGGRGDTFATAMAAGDFDGDGFDDLAAGASYYGYPAPDNGPAGRVTVLAGSRGGITADGVQVIERTSAGAPAQDRRGRFGENLAAGDVDGDGRDDLAIHAAGERSASKGGGGVVHVVRGSRSGLDTSTWHLIAASGNGSGGPSAFGQEMSFADYNGDGRADLTVLFSGGAIVLYGSARGVDADSAQTWRASTAGIKGAGVFEDLPGGRHP